MLKTPLLYTFLALGASTAAALPSPAPYTDFVPAFGLVPKADYGPTPTEAFDKARELLAGGKLEEAEQETLNQLSLDPYSTEGYILMFDIAKAQPEPDVEAMLRWGKWLTWSYGATGHKAGVEVIAPKLNELYSGWDADTETLDIWSEEVQKAIKGASSKKQYRLAGHLINKLLELKPKDKKLRKTYDKLADKAGAELGGGAFVSDKVKRKSSKWLAKNNAKHSDWENRWEKKTKNYNIETTMDYEFFETVSAVMDEMNAFYRDVYSYKKKTPRVRLAIHKKRSDFDRFTQEITGAPMQSEGVGGFWLVNAKTVNAYDRSMGDPNQTRADLWNTLFHEASHQFMSLIMDKSEKRNYPIPAWLNEGSASYFEGCVIKADGTILKNNVAEGRLRSWYFLENSNERKTLKQLVAHERNAGPDMERRTRSYEGEYYPYGWAFVYFLLNYEEGDLRVYGPAISPGEGIPAEYKKVRKAGSLVYRQAYLDYLAFFAKEGNKDSDQYYPWEMAKKFFIDDIGDPDIPNWEAFENRWRRFTNSLYGEMIAGPEFADVLQARCRGYLLAEDYERARTSAEQADLKRPQDAETYRLMALANQGEGLDGDAMYWMVRHWEEVWPSQDAIATKEAEDWISKNGGKHILTSYIEPSKVALDSTKSIMESALSDGHPIMATLFATHLMQAFQLQFPDLAEQAKEMSEIAGQDLRVWQAAFNNSSEANRRATNDNGSVVDVVLYEDDGVLIYNPKGWAAPGLEFTSVSNLKYLSPPYSMRGTIQLDGSAAAIPLGIDNSGSPQTYLIFAEYSDTEDSLLLKTASFGIGQGSASLNLVTVGGFRWDRVNEIHFTLDVDAEGNGQVTVNGDVEKLPEAFTKSKLTGGFALTTGDESAALFSNLEVRPSTAFWPVSTNNDE